MDNQLTVLTNNIAKCDTKEVAKQVMTICRAITPQFYKNLSVEEMRAERLSIELLTANIDQDTLAEMCKRAVASYPLRRSKNNKCYFDMNYLLDYYIEAFNEVHCKSVELPSGSKLIKSEYNSENETLTEYWESPKGDSIIIQEIKKEEDNHKYSSKFIANLNDTIGKVEL